MNDELEWRKSSKSNGSGGSNCVQVAWKSCGSGTCVEVSNHEGHYYVRDSKDPEGAVLKFTPAEWAAFVEGVMAGEFRF